MADEKCNPLVACHDDLVRGLDPHVDCLVEKFSQMSLLTEDELADLRVQEDQVKYLLDVVYARKERHNDSQCFDELIMFMKNRQDSCLSELADRMRISQEDDEVPCVPAEQSESSAAENKCELIHQSFSESVICMINGYFINGLLQSLNFMNFSIEPAFIFQFL